MTGVIMFFLVLLGPGATGMAWASPEREPRPAETERAAARHRMLRVFARQYERQERDAVVAFARELIARANDPGAAPTDVDAMLTEARDLASDAGDLGLAFDAIDALCRRFETDRLAEEHALLIRHSRSCTTAEDSRQFARASGPVIDRLIASGSYEAAGDLAMAADLVARDGDDAALTVRAHQRRQTVITLVRQHRAVRGALDRLAKDPDDPAANLAVGRFECLVIGQWSRGLNKLAKAPDGAYRRAALMELHEPTDAADVVALAEIWSGIARRSGGPVRRGAFERAMHWYQDAARVTHGLDRAEYEGRIEECLRALGLPWGFRLLTESQRGEVLMTGRKALLVVDMPATWDDARHWCDQRGAQLAGVAHSQHNAMLTALMRGTDPAMHAAWLGATDRGHEGRWRWQDGTAFAYQNWAPHQPDNRHGVEHRLSLQEDGTWNDVDGDVALPFIAQWAVPAHAATGH